ncbi:MAG: TadE/TadG family type IV pilus assembly protein [Acetobacteraceae bacterium]
MLRLIVRLLGRRENRCIAALEFALLSPVFIMVFAGIVDLGNAIYTWSKLEQALAAGANFALVNRARVTTDGSTLAQDIATLVSTSNGGTPANATVVVNNGPTVTRTGGNASASGTAANANSCYCPTGGPSNWTWGGVVTCGNTCTGGSRAGQFVTITASYSYTALFSSYGFVSNGTITAGAAVQTQ